MTTHIQIQPGHHHDSILVISPAVQDALVQEARALAKRINTRIKEQRMPKFLCARLCDSSDITHSYQPGQLAS